MKTNVNDAIKAPYTRPEIEESCFQTEAGIAMSIATDPNQGAVDFTVVDTWEEMRRNNM